MMSSFQKQLYLLQRLGYPVLEMVHLQWFTCDELLAMGTRDNRHIMLYELSLEGLQDPEINDETVCKSYVNWL